MTGSIQLCLYVQRIRERMYRAEFHVPLEIVSVKLDVQIQLHLTGDATLEEGRIFRKYEENYPPLSERRQCIWATLRSTI